MAAAEVPLEPGTLCVADLHLDPAGDERVERFTAWLAGLHGVPRLVLLGDVFDVWVGPAQARTPGAAATLAALSALSAGSVAIEVVPGNRDFLLDATFDLLTGARRHPRGFVGRLAGRPGREGRALLVHGDELCTKDHAYQRMKKVLRSRPVSALARRLPLAVARRAAAGLRGASVRSLARKPAPQKAMQADACRLLAERAEADAVICGHAHEFRDERLAGGPRWIVLDAWGGRRDLLRLRPDGEWAVESTGHSPLGR